MTGSQDSAEKSKKLDAAKATVGQHFDIEVGKAKRKAIATYMGGQRWRITLEKPSRG